MGCMFAGKSTELLRRLRKHEITEKKVLIIKFKGDQRYSEKCEVVTHCGQARTAVAAVELNQVGNKWKKFDVIGIDEG
jgi:thymidine kinase